MDKKLCGECHLPINDLEPVRCGFCDSFFHIGQQCSGFNGRAHKELFAQGKAIYICSACKIELGGKSIRAYLAEKLNDVPAAPSNANLSDKFQLLCDTVGTLSNKVDRLMLSHSRNDLSPTPPVWPSVGVKRRRGDNDTGRAVRQSADRGTKSIDFSDLSVATIIPAPPPVRWWLYLSGFHPSITDSDVRKVVTRCLDITGDDSTVDVVRLVPKGMDISNMTFVSFKIGLDPSFEQSALMASSWPTGLLFREFVVMPKNRYGGTTAIGIPPPVSV